MMVAQISSLVKLFAAAVLDSRLLVFKLREERGGGGSSANSQELRF